MRGVTEQWTFLTNHAHVLVLLDRDPDMRMRDLAREIGITERATQRIISELVESGYLTRPSPGTRSTSSSAPSAGTDAATQFPKYLESSSSVVPFSRRANSSRSRGSTSGFPGRNAIP
jgi:hypothetical protein